MECPGIVGSHDQQDPLAAISGGVGEQVDEDLAHPVGVELDDDGGFDVGLDAGWWDTKCGDRSFSQVAACGFASPGSAVRRVTGQRHDVGDHPPQTFRLAEHEICHLLPVASSQLLSVI